MYILVLFVCLRLQQTNTEPAMDLTDKQIFFFTSINKLLVTYKYHCMKAKYELKEIEKKIVIYS